jgi:hypothetical protein
MSDLNSLDSPAFHRQPIPAVMARVALTSTSRSRVGGPSSLVRTLASDATGWTYRCKAVEGGTGGNLDMFSA